MKIYELSKSFIALFIYSYLNDELPSNSIHYFLKIHLRIKIRERSLTQGFDVAMTSFLT